MLPTHDPFTVEVYRTTGRFQFILKVKLATTRIENDRTSGSLNVKDYILEGAGNNHSQIFGKCVCYLDEYLIGLAFPSIFFIGWHQVAFILHSTLQHFTVLINHIYVTDV